jgi:hypothetical protein
LSNTFCLTDSMESEGSTVKAIVLFVNVFTKIWIELLPIEYGRLPSFPA